MKNSVKEFASAKFIRFLPTKYNKFKVLRVEAYGILFSKGIYVFSFLPLCWRSNYKGRLGRVSFIYGGPTIAQ